ncbi:hypothetical protein [Streptomyces sp. NPDC060194]|uniref:DNA polymerase Y family protein n=1 Tax=Streptomyces sp. NPDC060194 TaxID=3347069 RepID=UPI00366393CD
MILCLRFHLPPSRTSALPELVALLGRFTPLVEALPPDGALADIGGALRYFDRDAAGLAAMIRVRAIALHGVDCTIGAGPNPMLATMAAREARPGEPRVVDDPAGFLDLRPVVALPGVGTATARALCDYGLDSIGRVAAAPLPLLQRLVGVRTGRELHEKAHGTDRSAVVPGAATRSIAGEVPFVRDEVDPAHRRRALLALAEDLGGRLRAGRQVGRTLVLTVRYADRTTTVRSRTLPEPTAHSLDLRDLAYRMHDALGLQRARVRALALRIEGIGPAEEAARQLTFDPQDDKARRIEAVADRARARFGPSAVVPGTLSDAA